ncbi:Transcription initiation factor TFIID subunit 12, partial [Fragariocoptes setiger]
MPDEVIVKDEFPNTSLIHPPIQQQPQQLPQLLRPQLPEQPQQPQIASLSQQPQVGSLAQQPHLVQQSQLQAQPHQPQTQQQPSQNSSTMNQESRDNNIPALDKRRLQELVDEIDPDERLDEDVEDSLLEIADDFIENVTTSACRLALHRKSTSLSVEDIQMVLEKNFKIHIPGFGKPLIGESSPKKAFVAEAHRQRMALIKRTIKKMNGGM